MFEEAAGIHKYRTQKKSTLRKFEITKNDLERIKDIIAEIEQKVRSLELQLKRYKRHASLSETLEKKDLELAFLQIHRFQEKAVPMQEKIQEYQHLRESKTSETNIHEKELNQLKEQYKNQEAILHDLQNLMEELNEKRENIRNDILVSSEKARGSILTVERLEREKSNNFKKIESLKQLSLDFAKEMVELEPAIDEYLEMYKLKKEDFQKIEAKYTKKVNQLDEMQNNRWELKRKIADDNSIFERTVSIIEEKKSEERQLKDDLTKLTENKKEQKGLEKNHKIEKNHNDKIIENLKNTLMDINTKIESFRTDLNEISEQKHTVKALKKSLEGQKEFYGELLESKEGFPQGTKYVLENPKLFPQVLGTVADMFHVDEKFRDAIEVGLGDLSHSLITKDRSTALLVLQRANELEAGDLTIIPLKEALKLQVDLKNPPKLKQNVKRA